ncbi:hypothetical protein BRD17_05275 [Halobacteriales archaeon SW_7_68_16]|nr:MAG: hypothetical protein BRD17_05275 [Halobacteriales archaeon SW_7_68_16]
MFSDGRVQSHVPVPVAEKREPDRRVGDTEPPTPTRAPVSAAASTATPTTVTRLPVGDHVDG